MKYASHCFPAAHFECVSKYYRCLRSKICLKLTSSRGTHKYIVPNKNRLALGIDLGGDQPDSMTLIMASSTSSSPIHNHRQPNHQHNRYNNLGQYHQGVMTLRRPVMINNQYYGGSGGTTQRNVLQQPDVRYRIIRLL